MNRTAIAITTACLLIAALLLTQYGAFGYSLFVVLPMLCGVLGAAVNKSTSRFKAARAGVIACFLASLLFLLTGREGLICLAMTIPLSLVFGAAGGLLYLWMFQSKRTRAAFLLIPIPLASSLGFDATARSPIYDVTTSIEINAPPERVWRHVTAFPDLATPREWYFKTGLAYPTGTRIVGIGIGAERYCDFSTGPAVETVTRWEPARLLEFDVTSTPAPMVEWSPYGNIRPEHLHDYMVSKRGQFRLVPLAGGRTLLVGTSWYQHGLFPARYWSLWSDAVIHRIHRRVLEHIRQLAEN
jgi:uncharacterized protein YndB with AHSA1/START domain